MQQDSLFAHQQEKLALPMKNAEVTYLPEFLEQDYALQVYQKLRDELAWHQDAIQMYGRSVLIPRLQAWYGDSQAVYTYSGLTMTPLPWTATLLALKDKIQTCCDATFNSVLANWYRDGQDSMGWHSDDEPELGHQPVIASLSLGQSRDFDFRNKNNNEKLRVRLENGSLLIMAGETQRYWQHGISKRTKNLGGRINLTFRKILTGQKSL